MIKLIKNIILGVKNTVTVNGISLGKNVQKISFNTHGIELDGKSFVIEGKSINVEVTGDVAEIHSGSGKVNVAGSVTNKIRTGSGDVKIGGSISGSINTGSGDVAVAYDLIGDVKTGSGDLTCRNYSGTFKGGSGKMKINQ